MHKTIDGNKQTYEADMDKHWSTGWRTAAGKVHFHRSHLFVYLVIIFPVTLFKPF